MKILAATTTFKPDLREAISKNVVGLYNEISREADVTLLAPGSLSSNQQGAQFVFKSFSDFNPYGSGRALFFNIRKLRACLKKMELSDFDLIHLHVGFCIELFLLFPAIRRTSIPVMVTVWQPYLEASEVRSIFRPGLLRLMKGILPHVFFNSFLLRPLYRNASKAYRHIVVSSRCQRKQMLKFASADQVGQSANGVAASSEADRAEGVPSVPRLLYIGHYTPAKGVNCILKALSLLKERCSFQMTFSFSDRGHLGRFWTLIDQYGLHDRVTVKGGVHVYKEMSRHDLFLIPYYTSIGVSYYPNVVLECFAAGLPLISTEIPVMREMLEEVAKDLLVPVNNPLALADRVVSLLNNRERLDHIGNVLKKLHGERYDLVGWAKCTVAEYENLLKGVRG